MKGDPVPRAATDRLEVRLQHDLKARIQRAADLLDVPLSDFVRSAAGSEADRVLLEHTTTVLPAEFFDRLMAALDEPQQPSPALMRAAGRLARVTQR